MNIAAIDQLAAKLQRVGQAGALPKDATQAQLIDELQRELASLADASRAMLSEFRAGPRYAKDAQLFLVDCRSGGNVLSTAQANLEGFGVTAGLAIYRHGLGYKLDRAVQVYFAYTPSVGVVDGQAARSGAVAVFAYDDNRTIFQVDQDAVTNAAVFVVSCYPSLVVPSKTTNPGQAAKTGAATPQLGTITAATAAGLP